MSASQRCAVWVVASLVGAWIEMYTLENEVINCEVASLVGAWIEIPAYQAYPAYPICRFPCGSVD